MSVLDYLVGGLVTAMWIFAGIYLWIHPSDLNFATWGGICGTLTCVYHWLNIKDDKQKDSA